MKTLTNKWESKIKTENIKKQSKMKNTITDNRLDKYSMTENRLDNQRLTG